MVLSFPVVGSSFYLSTPFLYLDKPILRIAEKRVEGSPLSVGAFMCMITFNPVSNLEGRFACPRFIFVETEK